MAGRTKLGFKPASRAALGVALLVALSACGGAGFGSNSSSTAAKLGMEGSGSGATGSAGFIVPGGDNSVQRFGSEAPAEEREAASGVLESYLHARSAENWGAACAALSARTAEPLEELAASSPKAKGTTCAAALAALAGSRPAPTDNLAGPIGALRVEGDRGFALFHGSDGNDYVVPMQREGSIWKVATLEPVELS